MIDWGKEWKSAHERSPLRVTPLNADKWSRFWSEDAEYYLKAVRESSGFNQKVIDRLAAEGWIEPGDEILDIGSGPGTYAIPMSRRVRSITALDEAEGMLIALRNEAFARGIDNISTVHRSWPDFPEMNRYDLVLAALTPAVRTAEGLFAMEIASRSKCCFITACPCEWMDLRNELWRKVVGEFVPSDAGSIKYPLNLLLEADRRPELYFVAADVVERNSEMELIDHYLRYFRIFTDMTSEKEEVVRERISSQSQDGIFTIQGSRCLYLLCWTRQ